METRAEYLQWCKDRAMEHVKRGELLEGVTSMMSDMEKHPETKLGPALSALGIHAAMQAQQGNRDMVERYILGFN
jgi:hypothetical protein